MDPHILNRPADDGAAETDDWDNDDFVIPSLSVEESDLGDWEISPGSAPQPPPKVHQQQPTKDTENITKDTENIYLGPHGAPPSRGKKQEETWATTGYRDKNTKGREAEQKAFGTARGNKGGNFHRYNHAGYNAREPYKRST